MLMEAKYILLISVGGVFAFLFLLYMLVDLERLKSDKRREKKLYESYREENLKKMEYDVAFFDEDAYRQNGDGDSQVTIDDVLNAQKESSAKHVQPVFVQVEEEGVEEIHGNYDPDRT